MFITTFGIRMPFNCWDAYVFLHVSIRALKKQQCVFLFGGGTFKYDGRRSLFAFTDLMDYYLQVFVRGWLHKRQVCQQVHMRKLSIWSFTFRNTYTRAKTKWITLFIWTTCHNRCAKSSTAATWTVLAISLISKDEIILTYVGKSWCIKMLGACWSQNQLNTTLPFKAYIYNLLRVVYPRIWWNACKTLISFVPLNSWENVLKTWVYLSFPTNS